MTNDREKETIFDKEVTNEEALKMLDKCKALARQMGEAIGGREIESITH